MSDRQSQLFTQEHRREDRAALSSVLGQRSRGRSILRGGAALAGGLGGLCSLGMFVWASLGHLFLQPQFTYAQIFGTRQGETAGVAELAAAPKKAEATNLINRQTAKSDADKQAIIIRQTTDAKAEQNAIVAGTAISRNAPLEAASECTRRIRSEAVMRTTNCLGTGTAGAECEARGELVALQEANCGSLDLPDSSKPGIHP